MAVGGGDCGASWTEMPDRRAALVTGNAEGVATIDGMRFQHTMRAPVKMPPQRCKNKNRRSKQNKEIVRDSAVPLPWFYFSMNIMGSTCRIAGWAQYYSPHFSSLKTSVECIHTNFCVRCLVILYPAFTWKHQNHFCALACFLRCSEPEMVCSVLRPNHGGMKRNAMFCARGKQTAQMAVLAASRKDENEQVKQKLKM